MKYFLPPVIPAVQNQPITVLGDALGSGDIPRHADHAPDQFQLLIADIVHGRDRIHRHNEDVLRRDIRIQAADTGAHLTPAAEITGDPNAPCPFFVEAIFPAANETFNLTVGCRPALLTGPVNRALLKVTCGNDSLDVPLTALKAPGN